MMPGCDVAPDRLDILALAEPHRGDARAVLDPRRARHDRADHRVERVELVRPSGTARRRSAGRDAHAPGSTLSSSSIGLAEEAAPAHAGAGRPDDLDGAVRLRRRSAHSSAARMSTGRSIIVSMHQSVVGLSPVDASAAVGGRSPPIAACVHAGLGDLARVAVEHEPQRVELGVHRRDLGQHRVRVMALLGDRLRPASWCPSASPAGPPAHPSADRPPRTSAATIRPASSPCGIARPPRPASVNQPQTGSQNIGMKICHCTASIMRRNSSSPARIEE